jgi:hypothetical protein
MIRKPIVEPCEARKTTSPVTPTTNPRFQRKVMPAFPEEAADQPGGNHQEVPDRVVSSNQLSLVTQSPCDSREDNLMLQQVAKLVVHIGGSADRVFDLRPKGLAESSAQAVQSRPDSRIAQVRRRG